MYETVDGRGVLDESTAEDKASLPFFNTAASYSHTHIASSFSLYVDDTSLSGGRRGTNGWLRGVSPRAGSMPKEAPPQTLSLNPPIGCELIPVACPAIGRAGLTCFYGIY